MTELRIPNSNLSKKLHDHSKWLRESAFTDVYVITCFEGRDLLYNFCRKHKIPYGNHGYIDAIMNQYEYFIFNLIGIDHSSVYFDVITNRQLNLMGFKNNDL